MSSQPEAELVDTSDAEEQELQAADSTQYWGHSRGSPGSRTPPRKRPRLTYDLSPPEPLSDKPHLGTISRSTPTPSNCLDNVLHGILTNTSPTPPRAATRPTLPIVSHTHTTEHSLSVASKHPHASEDLFSLPTNQHIPNTGILNTPHPNEPSTSSQTSNYHLQATQHNGRPYSLRNRAPRQLNPYQFDAALYKQQMRAAPEAIIKLRHIEREARQIRRDQDYEETRDACEEPQDIFEPVESDIRQTQRIPSPPIRAQRPFPDILKDFADSDEDNAEVKALRREAKKAARRLKQKEKEKEKAKRIRPLPFDASPNADDSDQNRDNYSEDRRISPESSANVKARGRRSSTPGSLHSKGDLNPSSDYGLDVFNTDAHEPPSSPTTSEPELNPVSKVATLDDALKELGPSGKVLKKMYPAFMLSQLLQPSSRRRQDSQIHSPSSSQGEEDEAELRPGQSRRRRGYKEPVAVKGDTESSEDERSSPLSSPTSPLILPSLSEDAKTTLDKQDVIELTSGEDSSDAMSDGEIAALLTRDHADSKSRLDKGNGIDYMLSRTRFVGGSRNQGSRKSTKSLSRRKGNSNRLVQATLTTYGYSQDARKGSWVKGTQADRTAVESDRYRSYRTTEDGNGIHTANVVGGAEEGRKGDKRTRRRQRRKAPQKLYTFANGDTVVVNRHHGSLDSVTIDFEDQEQQVALTNEAFKLEVPSSKFRTAGRPRFLLSQPKSPSSSKENRTTNTEPSNKCRITTKMGISQTIPPIKFGSETYIGRGHLRELTRLLRDDAQPHARPSSYGAFGLYLDSETNSTQLVACLLEMWDRMLEDITNCFEENDTAGHRFKDWQGLTHACCQRVSWIPSETSSEETANFREAVKMQIIGFISRLEDAFSSSNTPVTHQKLIAAWFAVEVSVRLGCQLSADIVDGIDINPLRRAIISLITLLLQHGLDKSIRPLEGQSDLLSEITSTTVDQYSLEIWLCLLHITRFYQTSGTSTNHLPDDEHPISHLILEAMDLQVASADTALRISEQIWLSVFALSKIGQLSEHGLVVSNHHPEPMWSLVSRALSAVQLTTKPSEEPWQENHHMTMRDGLIRLIFHRCCRLWTAWRWNFGGALAVLKQLSEVFRSRRFSGLIGDAAEFPGFLRDTNPGLLMVFEEDDDAFVIFLKLLVRFERGLRDDSDFNTPGTNYRKILTLAIPSGALPVTKGTPSDSALSMLINRFSGLAMTVCIEPKGFDYRIQQARGYVQFKQSDHTTQTTCIRGAMYLAMLAISLDISAKAAFQWLGDMISDLLDMFASISSKMDKALLGNAPAVIIFALVAMRQSVGSLASRPNARWDAAPFREGWIQKLTKNTCINIMGVRSAFSLLILAFLDAFPETRPNHTSSLNEDSQDDYDSYGFDEDALQEALGENTELSSLKASAKTDLVTAACDYLDQAVFRLMCNELKRPLIDTHKIDSWMAGAEVWIECWTRLANLAVQSGKRSWTAYLDLRNDTWGKLQPETLRRRVELFLLTCILRLDHKAYQPTGRFFAVFLESLTTPNITSEPLYCSLFVKKGGFNHPLLAGIVDRGCEISSTESFLIHQKEILEAIFFNLSQKLEQNSPNEAADNRKYLADAVKMFQSMAEIHPKLDQTKQHQYAVFYNEILSSATSHPALRDSPNLQRWIQWGREHG